MDFSLLTCNIHTVMIKDCHMPLYIHHQGHQFTKLFHCSNWCEILFNILSRWNNPTSIVVFSSLSLPATWRFNYSRFNYITSHKNALQTQKDLSLSAHQTNNDLLGLGWQFHDGNTKLKDSVCLKGDLVWAIITDFWSEVQSMYQFWFT